MKCCFQEILRVKLGIDGLALFLFSVISIIEWLYVIDNASYVSMGVLHKLNK